MKQNNQDEEDELEELLEDDEEADEVEELEDEDIENLPTVPRKISSEAAKKIKAAEKAKTLQNQNVPIIAKKNPTQQIKSDRVKQIKLKRYYAAKQPERIAVVTSDTGEVIADDMPLWAAQMWADLKSDIEDLKSAIGNM